MTDTADPASCDPDQAWKALSLVNDWVKHAETKSATILAASGISGGVLYNLVKGETSPGWWLTIVGGVCGLAIFLAGGCALLALTPRTGRVNRVLGWAKARRKPSPQPVGDAADNTAQEDLNDDAPPVDADPSNLLFFAHIARDYADDSPTYTQVLSALTSDKRGLTEHIARQIHANAGVAHRKFRWAERAIRWLALALATLAWVAVLVGERGGG